MTSFLLLKRTGDLLFIFVPLGILAESANVDRMESTAAMNWLNTTSPPAFAGAVSPTVMMACQAMVIVLGFIACACNAGILMLSFCIRGSYGPVLKLTFGLAAADCWTSFIIAFSFLVYLEVIIVTYYGNCVMLMLEMFRMSSVFTSILHLLIMAMNHYQQIHVQQAATLFSSRMISLLMVSAWIIPTLLFFIGFFSVPNDGFGRLFISGPSNSTHDCGHDFMNGMGYRASIYVSLLLPVLIMIVLYAFMMRQLYSMERQFERQNRRSRSVRMKQKMLLTIVLMISSFVIGWVPSGTWLLIMTPGYGISSEVRKSPVLSFCMGVIVNFLMVLKFLVNPIIYALRIPEIHDVLHRPFMKSNNVTLATGLNPHSKFKRTKEQSTPLVDGGLNQSHYSGLYSEVENTARNTIL